MFTIAKLALSDVSYSIDKLYDYVLPAALAPLAQVGMRVRVPFGRSNKKIEGFILKLENGSDIKRLKAVAEICDESPLLDEEMIRLVARIRSHYYCTFFDAVKCVLPTGLWLQRSESYYLKNPENNPEILERYKNSKIKTTILHFFIENNREYTEKGIITHLGEQAMPHVKELLREEALGLHSLAARRTGDQKIKLLSLSMPLEEAKEHITRKRSQIYTEILQLLSSGQEIEQKELCYHTGATTAQIGALVKGGILRLRLENGYRRPHYQSVGSGGAILLSPSQEKAFFGLNKLLSEDKAHAALLLGVTGSGKTQIYIKLIEEALKEGKGAILMVPEIALTPQLMQKFLAYFGENIAVVHSALSDGERYDEWKRLKEGKAKIAIGTRSAVFAPVQNLGIVIMDEEQEGSYKSDNSPRFHARDIAKYRCFQTKGLLLLGSATPSIESFFAAKQGNYRLFRLDERYQGTKLPRVMVADMRGLLREGESVGIGPVLEAEIQKNLEDNQQTVLFINRRGNSRHLSCVSCGYSPECPNCSVSMTFHSANQRTMCHYCGHSEKLPVLCPVCGSRHLKTAGPGTQKIEAELNMLFPSARVLRMDADTTSGKNSHEKILTSFAKGEGDILLGTQMVTKGLDFENVTLVGVVDSDQALFVEDYRAKERCFSLITQVVGRAGRRALQGRAVIQTYCPENFVILTAARQDYDRFFESEMVLREAMKMPPIADIIMLTCIGEDEELVLQSMMELRSRIQGLMLGQFKDFAHPVFGPTPAYIAKVNRKFRYHLSIRCTFGPRARELVAGLLLEFNGRKDRRDVHLFADVNPNDI